MFHLLLPAQTCDVTQPSVTHRSHTSGTFCPYLSSCLQLLVLLELLPDQRVDFAPHLHTLLWDLWIFSWVPTVIGLSLQAAESSPDQPHVRKGDFPVSSPSQKNTSSCPHVEHRVCFQGNRCCEEVTSPHTNSMMEKKEVTSINHKRPGTSVLIQIFRSNKNLRSNRKEKVGFIHLAQKMSQFNT